MFFQSCFLSDFIIIDCLFLFRGFRGLFFYSLFFYSAGVAFLFLLFLVVLVWVDLGGGYGFCVLDF
ncbi:hypothetical protein A608_0004 [Helicobacter pylori CCHI 33]|nr:hypothetical protein A608_0004 [Helicobacter pylori CCHI 33]